MYTYVITEDLIVNIYNPNGELIDYPGPWNTRDGAERWAEMRIEELNKYGENSETQNP